MVTTNGTDSALEQWDEAQYAAALARLEELSDRVNIILFPPHFQSLKSITNTNFSLQVTALRTAIPSLIAPLTRPATTRSAAFGGLKKAAIGAVTDVRDLRSEWESHETQRLLSKTKESYERDGDLTRAAEVEAWGWRKEGEGEMKEEEVRVKKEG